eukprot:406152-Hanusia_phi.AAC.1
MPWSNRTEEGTETAQSSSPGRCQTEGLAGLKHCDQARQSYIPFANLTVTTRDVPKFAAVTHGDRDSPPARDRCRTTVPCTTSTPPGPLPQCGRGPGRASLLRPLSSLTLNSGVTRQGHRVSRECQQAEPGLTLCLELRNPRPRTIIKIFRVRL